MYEISILLLNKHLIDNYKMYLKLYNSILKYKEDIIIKMV